MSRPFVLLLALSVSGCFRSEEVLRLGGDAGPTSRPDSGGPGPSDVCARLPGGSRPRLGFAGPVPPDGATLIVDYDGPNAIDLGLVGSSPPKSYRFEWRGPTLPFSAGSTVRAFVPPALDGWRGVASAEGAALVHDVPSAFSLPPRIADLPEIAEVGTPVVAVSRHTQCTIASTQSGMCGLSVPPTTLHAITLTQLDELASAPVGGTSERIWGWRLTNVASASAPSASTAGCVIEGLGDELLTAVLDP